MSNNADEPLHDGGLVHEHRWAREPNQMKLCTCSARGQSGLSVNAQHDLPG